VAASSRLRARPGGVPAVLQSVPGAIQLQPQLQPQPEPAIRTRHRPTCKHSHHHHRRRALRCTVKAMAFSRCPLRCLLGHKARTADFTSASPPSLAVACTLKPQPGCRPGTERQRARKLPPREGGSLRRGQAVHGACRRSVIQRGNSDGGQLSKHRGRKPRTRAAGAPVAGCDRSLFSFAAKRPSRVPCSARAPL